MDLNMLNNVLGAGGIDLKAKAMEIAEKLQKDPKLLEKFQKNPAAVIKEVIGVELPEAQVNQAIAAVKAKLNLDTISGAAGMLGGLLKK